MIVIIITIRTVFCVFPRKIQLWTGAFYCIDAKTTSSRNYSRTPRCIQLCHSAHKHTCSRPTTMRGGWGKCRDSPVRLLSPKTPTTNQTIFYCLS